MEVGQTLVSQTTSQEQSQRRRERGRAQAVLPLCWAGPEAEAPACVRQVLWAASLHWDLTLV